MKFIANFATCAIGISVAAMGFGLAQPAAALVEYDQNVTPNVIFGSGNANGSFTRDRRNGIEIGLRGKLRFNSSGLPENSYHSNGDGTYSFNNIVGPTKTTPTPEWSFEWSVNTDYLGTASTKLKDLMYELGLDGDPGLTTDFQAFDPINVPYADHSIGDNNTANGAGAEAADSTSYATLLANNNVAQNSWRYDFFISGALLEFDPTQVGTYAIYLLAKDSQGDVLARSEIQILVGGALPVSDVEYACVGFEPPLDTAVSVKKPNRVLPLRMALIDDQGSPVLGFDILANPVLQLEYAGESPGDANLDDLETAGKGDEGNMFVFDGSNWAFNMKTQGLAPGTYTITVVSGDLAEYVIDPTCEVTVNIQ